MKNLNGPSVETVSESLHKEKVRSLEAGTQMGGLNVGLQTSAATELPNNMFVRVLFSMKIKSLTCQTFCIGNVTLSVVRTTLHCLLKDVLLGVHKAKQ